MAEHHVVGSDRRANPGVGLRSSPSPRCRIGRLRLVSWPGSCRDRHQDGSAQTGTQHAPSLHGSLRVRMEAGLRRNKCGDQRFGTGWAMRSLRLTGVLRFLRHKEIYRPMNPTADRTGSLGLRAPRLIVSMSFQSAIPRLGCSPAVPASASPTAGDCALPSSPGQAGRPPPSGPMGAPRRLTRGGLLMEGTKAPRHQETLFLGVLSWWFNLPQVYH